jgi:hypothetical protein
MNPQIKALMDQTLDEKFSGTWSTMDMQDLQKFAERFSELIVRECADIATMNQFQWDSAGGYMLKHFGVKE